MKEVKKLLILLAIQWKNFIKYLNMSWSNLKAGISVVVKENNNQEITGTNLQNVLITIVNSLGANATCGGIAHPNTSPGTPDGPVFWIASGPGVYVNFGNTKIDNTGIFIWNGTSWSFEELDFMKNMQTDIANSVLQSVSFGVTGNTATLTIKQKGYDAITVSVPIATDSQSGFMTAEQAKYIDDLREYTDGLREDIDDLREDIPNLQNKLDAAYGEINIDNIDSLCTADDMLQGKPACYTVLYTLTTSKGTVTVKVGVLWVYSDNLRHVVMQVLNTNFVPDDDGTFSSHTHNHDMHEYSRIYCYDSNAASHAGVAVKTWTQWQEVGGKGIVDLITNVALAKQNKLVAGDKATRIIDNNLATKQIYKGTVININGVPVALSVGAYCFNTATKKLYVGDSNNQPVEVAKPDDFLFVDTASGTTYRCDGTTLNNIANIKTVNGQSLLGKGNVQLTGADFLLEQGAELTINEAVNSNTDALQKKLDKAAFDSFDKHPATYFSGFVSNIDAARYPKSCPFGLKQFSVVFDRRYTSDIIFREGYKVFELNGANAANDYLYLSINGWQIDFHARKSGGTAYNSKYLGSLSSQGTDHCIFTFNLETGEIKAYYSGELAWTDQLNDWDFDTYYPSNCKTYSLNPAVVSGKLGCALLNYCISDDDAAKLYQAGCYFDNFMPATYICYDKDVRKLTSYDKIRTSTNNVTLFAENEAIRIECSKSNGNEYLTYDNFIAPRDTAKMTRCTAHIKVISGDNFKFVGFAIHGYLTAKIYDSSDGSLYCEGAAKALLAGHEYDLLSIGVPNSAEGYLLNFSHGDSGVCEVSDITVTNLGAFLLCAPQNYVGSRFKQGNGEILNLNGGEAFYDLYKPRIVSTKGYPQFNGQLCITPADGKVYIAVRTAKGYTWKQINNT